MQALAEIPFIGVWRSFKVFKRTGAITLFTDKCFKEFKFMPGKLLIIKTYDQTNIKKIADTDQWSFSLKDKKHYLNIVVPKLNYEVVTVNHTVMVLVDTVSEDKIFFAKENYWLEHLKSNRMIII
jgi:hypothetical protein